MSWHEGIATLLDNNQYSSIAQWYEKRIENEPEDLTNYWYLGLAYLLSGEEELAGTTWLLPLSQADEEDAEQWTEDLIKVLEEEAERQKNLKHNELSLSIRQYIYELAPDNLSNWLSLTTLDLYINGFNPESFPDEEIIKLIDGAKNNATVSEKILELLVASYMFVHPKILSFAEACLPYVNTEEFVANTISFNVLSGCQYKNPLWSIELCKLCLKAQPNSLYLKHNLYIAYNSAGLLDEALAVAYEFEQLSQTPIQKIFAKALIIDVLQKGGRWKKLPELIEKLKEYLLNFSQQDNQNIKEDFIKGNLLSMIIPLRYYEDKLSNNKLQNQISQLFQENLPFHNQFNISYTHSYEKKLGDKLHIGYIANTLKRHSVGWLSRWLIHHHDRSNFQIYIYLINQKNDDITSTWFQKPGDKTYNLNTLNDAIRQIQSDAIDILVDLDSATSITTCQILALKPAPVQITWLGYDASGIPAVDYFVADNYSLPENAQDYYREKIWRLPNSYLSVDGFEVGIPTLKRKDLDIPTDAVIYLTAQTGMKRHPDTIRLQMRIIASVSNSYLLVKGAGDSKTIEEIFREIAISEGVSPERLRFLPIEANEETHRANLTIADVVLDTYPYGGATTTLEVLWVALPLVTRVGEQFAARNSYTFMVNAGISEGIAWSDKEYVEWGIKFGTDENLRKQVVEKLRLSRQTAPLWKGKEFTREMEKAYIQMWQAKIINKG